MKLNGIRIAPVWLQLSDGCKLPDLCKQKTKIQGKFQQSIYCWVWFFKTVWCVYHCLLSFLSGLPVLVNCGNPHCSCWLCRDSRGARILFSSVLGVGLSFRHFGRDTNDRPHCFHTNNKSGIFANSYFVKHLTSMSCSCSIQNSRVP